MLSGSINQNSRLRRCPTDTIWAHDGLDSDLDVPPQKKTPVKPGSMGALLIAANAWLRSIPGVEAVRFRRTLPRDRLPVLKATAGRAAPCFTPEPGCYLFANYD